jgi:peroxiredoxin
MKIFTTLLLCGALLAQSGTAQSLSGRRAPSFSLPDSAMRQHDLLDSRGRWVLLDFMETNCPHCKALSKTLEGIKARYGAKVEILSIVLSPPENQLTAAKYIAENKVTSPILFDQGQVAVSYFKATPANPSFDTPHLFAIDPNGMIVRDWAQASAESPGLLKDLDLLLGGGAGKK